MSKPILMFLSIGSVFLMPAVLMAQKAPLPYLPSVSTANELTKWGKSHYATAITRRIDDGTLLFVGVNSPGAFLTDNYLYLKKGDRYYLNSMFANRFGKAKVRKSRFEIAISYSKDKTIDIVRLKPRQ